MICGIMKKTIDSVNGIDSDTWLCEMNSIPEKYCLILNGERAEIVI